ncbi:MAG: VanZ family protein [Flavobacteriaceae bacterium]
MLRHTKTLLRRSSLYISLTITILITFLSLIKIQAKPLIQISNEDKIHHALAYLVLTLSWLITKSIKFKKTTDFVIILSCFVFGIIIEALQAIITTYRSASYLDILANLIGIIFGFIIFKALTRKKADI